MGVSYVVGDDAMQKGQENGHPPVPVAGQRDYGRQANLLCQIVG